MFSPLYPFVFFQLIANYSVGFEHVKSRKTPFSVIPVKTGIQEIQEVLDSRLRGSDDYGAFTSASNLRRSYGRKREYDEREKDTYRR
jgi:hypothetical protein